ncbi:hypothetical protein CASFOL_035945 [Castilleja foliolosa]|uniref:BHLH domain-containing protein n=1 Tax=Castilleja foliolosa TaxID=1961234 RepID=A0ABD3BUX9_9LAMI
MEISSFNCLADLGMGDLLLLNQWPHHQIDDPIENLSPVSITSTFSEDYFPSNYNNNITIDSHKPIVLDFKRSSSQNNINNKPSKQLKTNHSCKPENLSYSPNSINNNLVDSGLTNNNFPESNVSSQNYVLKSGRSTGYNSNRLAHDHIMAERKRREKLSLRFVALSALVPGLKKMDKASVLGDAINHIKQLQEKVKTLENQTKKTKMESFVYVKKYEVHASESSENSSSDNEQSISSGPTITESLPEIEARFCDKDVLISIHCEKRKGVLEKIIAQIENLHLSVVNSSVMSFGDSALSITVVAQKDEEFNVNMKELVKKLRSVL